MSNQIVAVMGATGAQGGGLARAILNDPDREWSVRAVTRNPASDNAQALKELGAELVQADADDQASLERAYRGADAVFAITNFWEHFSAEREKEQAGNQARAAKAAGVKHVIWSTLEDTRDFIPVDDDRMPTLQGKYNVPHFDAKGESDQAFRDSGVPSTFLRTSFYWDNLLHFGMHPQKQEDGTYGFVLPMGDSKLPGIAVDDIGRAAYAILKRGTEFAGQHVGIAGEHLTGAEMAKKLSKATGRDVRHLAVPPEVYRTFDFPGADDMGNMFQYNAECADEFCGQRSISFTRTLVPDLLTFDQWLSKNAAKLPME